MSYYKQIIFNQQKNIHREYKIDYTMFNTKLYTHFINSLFYSKLSYYVKFYLQLISLSQMLSLNNTIIHIESELIKNYNSSSDNLKIKPR